MRIITRIVSFITTSALIVGLIPIMAVPALATACTPKLTIVPSASPVANNGPAAFTITMRNAGTGTCSGLHLSLYYPSALTFSGASPAATASNYYWYTPSLGAEQSKSVVLYTQASVKTSLPRAVSLEGCMHTFSTARDVCARGRMKIVAGDQVQIVSPALPTAIPPPSLSLTSVPDLSPTPATPHPTATPTPLPIPTPPPTATPTPTVSPSSAPIPTPPPTVPPETPLPDVSVNSCTVSPSNILPNPGFETPDDSHPQGWTPYRFGTNSGTFTYLTAGGSNNSRAIAIQTTQYTNGDAYWASNPVPVKEGTIYEYRDKYRATFQGEIDAVYTMEDGSIEYGYVGTAAQSMDWNEFYALFTVPQGAVSVMIYHTIYGIGTLTVDDVSLREYKPMGFNRGMVTLTFDDHPPITHAFSVFDKYGVQTTHYLSTELGPLPGYPDVTTPETVRALRDAGHEIGGHTKTHSFLLQIPLAQVLSELVDSQATLRQWLGDPNAVTNFAPPYGETDNTIRQLIAQHYDSSRSVDAGYNDKCNFDRYNLKVQNIFNTTTLDDVRGWVATAKRDRTWLILVYHAVTPETNLGKYSTHPDDLDAHIASMISSGITIKTVKDALAELSPQL